MNRETVYRVVVIVFLSFLVFAEFMHRRSDLALMNRTIIINDMFRSNMERIEQLQKESDERWEVVLKRLEVLDKKVKKIP